MLFGIIIVKVLILKRDEEYRKIPTTRHGFILHKMLKLVFMVFN